ncbi:putative fatty acid-binding protein, partial [Pseudolycoriella hygida]
NAERCSYQVSFQSKSTFKMAWVGKKYKLEKSENFGDYMKALGVGMMLRQVGNTVYPTVDLVKNGDEYSFTTSSTFKTTVIKFKEGEEFDEETLDGRKIRSVITFDGDKMIHDQKGDKGHIIYRVFTETDLTVTMELDGIKVTRYYKAV